MHTGNIQKFACFSVQAIPLRRWLERAVSTSLQEEPCILKAATVFGHTAQNSPQACESQCDAAPRIRHTLPKRTNVRSATQLSCNACGCMRDIQRRAQVCTPFSAPSERTAFATQHFEPHEQAPHQ